jgi:hypothetical protein
MPKVNDQSSQSRPCSGRRRTLVSSRGRRARRGHLRVDARPDLRKEPDWDRFAWALLQHVRAKREAAEAARVGGPVDE